MDLRSESQECLCSLEDAMSVVTNARGEGGQLRKDNKMLANIFSNELKTHYINRAKRKES